MYMYICIYHKRLVYSSQQPMSLVPFIQPEHLGGGGYLVILMSFRSSSNPHLLILLIRCTEFHKIFWDYSVLFYNLSLYNVWWQGYHLKSIDTSIYSFTFFGKIYMYNFTYICTCTVHVIYVQGNLELVTKTCRFIYTHKLLFQANGLLSP